MRTSRRPASVTALAVFFFLGALIAAVSCWSLSNPGGFLEPMWRLNPRARPAFARMGVWALLLLSAVCLACASAAIGLWRGKRWGYGLALALIAINLAGDLVNVLVGTEPRAILGVPVAAALLTYLSTGRVRDYFREAPRSNPNLEL